MSIDRNTTAQSIDALASVENILMDPRDLTEDAVFLTLAFPDTAEYQTAVVNTVRAFQNLVRKNVNASKLSGTFQGWESYHYQPKVGQGMAADMHIIFKREANTVHVLAFGHRYIPSDLYSRAKVLRQSRIHKE